MVIRKSSDKNLSFVTLEKELSRIPYVVTASVFRAKDIMIAIY